MNTNQFVISAQLLSKLENYFLSFKSSYNGHCLLSSIYVDRCKLNLYLSWTHFKNNDFCLRTYNDLKIYSNQSELLLVVKFLSTDGFLSNRFPDRNSDKIINIDRLESDKTYRSLFSKILEVTPPTILIDTFIDCHSLKDFCIFFKNSDLDNFTKN